jgi:hypothetical protein
VQRNEKISLSGNDSLKVLKYFCCIFVRLRLNRFLLIFLILQAYMFSTFRRCSYIETVHTYLRTGKPPTNLYFNDSACATAQRPLVATFSAYNLNRKKKKITVIRRNSNTTQKPNEKKTSTVSSAKLKRF